MSDATTLPNKDPWEKLVVAFDFSAELDQGETLSGAITMLVSANNKKDATPSNFLNGGAAFDVSNSKVLQPVQGGMDQVDYKLICRVQTSNANKRLALAAVVPVRAL